MCKKSFVAMKRNQQIYKVYLSDVLRVHSVIIRKLPSTPAYSEMESEKNFDK